MAIYLDVLATIRQLSFSFQQNQHGPVNPHMHKMDSHGPKHYIFGEQFYLKNARKLRFHVFYYFYAGKHMIP